ncbi:DMT family transporter [Pseudomonas sp. Marseille-QA0892]
MTVRVFSLAALALLAFAGNSLLCRLALTTTSIDPATFTAIRLVSGAVVLAILAWSQHGSTRVAGNWPSALALFIYAAAFSFAYVELDAGAGALLLFGAVQLSMLGWGLLQGERLRPLAVGGLFIAFAGLVTLLLPGAHAPGWQPAGLMIMAGAAWGAYSLLGRRATSPALIATTGNFIRALPFVAILALIQLSSLTWDLAGLLYAVLSGAVTSGLGYALWYAALPSLRAMHAATLQLSVPVITLFAGALLLDEVLTFGLLAASAAVLGGIALVLLSRR